MWKNRSAAQRFYLLTLIVLGCSSFAALVSVARGEPINILLLVGIALAFAITGSFGAKAETARPDSVVIFDVSDSVFIFALLVAGAPGLFPLLVGSIISRYRHLGRKQPFGYLFNLFRIAITYCVLLAGLHAIGIAS